MNGKQKDLCVFLFAGIGGGSLGFMDAGFDTVGFELDPGACADYRALTGHPCHEVDLATITPDALSALVGPRAPKVVATSPPCQAYSGCLPLETSRTDRYQNLSSLSERGILLALEAWKHDPPSLFVLENVPNIKSRGRDWLNAIASMFQAYGYAWRETTHNCGELGPLAQNRQRFLGVARHHERCPEYLYRPQRHAMLTIGDVLGALPAPVHGAGGDMHRPGQLAALNWLRLALIPPGGDYRDIPERVRHYEHELDVRSTCVRRAGALGVQPFDGQTHAVIGAATPHNTGLNVADPRVLSPALTCSPRAGAYGVASWGGDSATIVASANMDNGRYSVADPRCPRATHVLRLADDGVYELHGPRLDLDDKRPCSLVIMAADGTHHRPMTTLELAALQGFPTRVGGEWLRLSGNAHKTWRKRIGNAIPPPAARAIAGEMRRTLDASEQGIFYMSGGGVWVEQTTHGTPLEVAR